MMALVLSGRLMVEYIFLRVSVGNGCCNESASCPVSAQPLRSVDISFSLYKGEIEQYFSLIQGENEKPDSCFFCASHILYFFPLRNGGEGTGDADFFPKLRLKMRVNQRGRIPLFMGSVRGQNPRPIKRSVAVGG